MTPTFHDLWAKAHFQDAHSTLPADDSTSPETASEGVSIEDLSDPHGKRLLFGTVLGTAQQSTSDLEAISAAETGALRRRGHAQLHAALCAFVTQCELPCDMCVQICARVNGQACSRWVH